MILLRLLSEAAAAAAAAAATPHTATPQKKHHQNNIFSIWIIKSKINNKINFSAAIRNMNDEHDDKELINFSPNTIKSTQ